MRIHLIGHAHLDPVWLWDWREGMREALATFRSAARLMAEHADYRFVASSAAFYAWIKRLDPQLIQEIRKYVRAGRWELVGGWWVEADENLPSGEGLIRQGIYGSRLFSGLFGEHVSVGFNPDAFGHPSSLPRILRALGQTTFFFMRPGPGEKSLPLPVFRWRSSDGSEVVAVRILSYNATTADVERKISAVVDESREAGLPAGVCFYGIGDHGGGPTRELLALLDGLELQGVELVYSTPSGFLRELLGRTKQLPVVEDELRHHAVGCYSVDRRVKLRNRRAEHALLALERWQTVRWLAGGRAPDFRGLESAWRKVLFNQFHDILAGTSIRSASGEARAALDGVLTYADEELEFALRHLAAEVSVPWPEGGFVVFNPWPWPVKAPLEFEYVAGPEEDHQTVVTPAGRAVPLQPVRRSDVTNLPRSRWVAVDEIPALGYKVYTLSSRATGAWNPGEEARVRLPRLENGLVHLEVEPESGSWNRLTLANQRSNFLAGAACVPVATRDDSDTWSHGIEGYEGPERSFRFAGSTVTEEGPVRVALRTDWKLGCSRVYITNRVYTQLPGVFVDVDVNWQQRRSVLRLLFPLDLENPVSVAEEPYGCVRREATGAEMSCQQWIAVEGTEPGSGKQRGVLVVNDGLWSYSLKGNLLRLTLLRSPVYAHHEPAKLSRGEIYDHLDLGRHLFRFWLLPYDGDLNALAPFRLASFFNLGVRVVKVPGHDGWRPGTGSWLQVEPENVLVSVVKKGFQRSELVLRCFETAGKASDVKVRSELLGFEGQFEIGPHELKTVSARQKGNRLVFRNLTALEDPL